MNPALPVTQSLQDLASALIMCLEGLRLQAYRDSGGVWTVGVGHTGPEVTAAMCVTPERAQELLVADQGHLLNMVAAAGCNTLDGAALASFGYNCGPLALGKVLAGIDSITNPVHTTDRHGTVLGGLVARRRLEALLMTMGGRKP